MTTLAIRSRAIGRKVKALALPSMPWKSLYAVALATIACMLVWYVMGVNQLTRGAYAIKEYNSQISQLNEEGAVLETRFAKTGFLGNVQQQVRELGFEKAGSVKYVKIIDQSLAQAPSHMVK